MGDRDRALLYVEDEAATREMVGRVIKREYPDMPLLVAANGAEGFELFRRHRPHIVLTDIAMPVMDGIELAQRIRKEDEEAFIIALTAYGDCDVLMKAIEIGFNHYLLKPVHFKKLFAVVNRCLALVDFRLEHARVETALRDSEQRLSKVFHTAPALMAISTLEEGKIIDINDTALRTLGYQREEVIDRTCTELGLWPGIDRTKVVEALKTGLPVHDVEMACVRKDRKTLKGLYSAHIIDVDGQHYLLSTVRDITNLKLAQTELRESEQRFDSFMSHLPAAAWIKDLGGRYVYANPELQRLVSASLAEIKGKTDQEIFTRDTAASFVDSDRRVVNEGCTESSNEADGIYRFALVSRFPVPGPDGTPAHIGGVAFDITDRQRAKEEIERLNATLEARAKDLEAANQELEAFNFSVSHDLRQPLNLIAGYCQMMLMQCREQKIEFYLKNVEKVYQVTLQMNDLIDVLLNFSRVTKVELRTEKVDLCQIVRAVFGQLQTADPERTVELTCAEVVTVEGDESLLQVAMGNLIGNAWKFTGGRDQATIEFGAEERNGEPVYYIRDNGVGFDGAYAEQIFLPFQRLPGTARISGHGIGLAMVQKIIARHGGRIWAESEPGKGATFYFTLPAGGEFPPGCCDPVFQPERGT